MKKPVYDIVKRIIDFVLALLAFIILSPLFLICCIVISLSDKQGHPIFSQKRCGKNGKLFTLYKFRTMRTDAEQLKQDLMDRNEMDGPVFKIKDDPRITKVGKFLRATCIDELPQLINIIKGDMSIVGPRPALPEEVEEYTEEQKIRLSVFPGLTCYWQVSPNRNDITFEEWMELDRKYINDRSLGLDIKLIFKTMIAVVKNHDGR